jgi:hypothetical protein
METLDLEEALAKIVEKDIEKTIGKEYKVSLAFGSILVLTYTEPVSGEDLNNLCKMLEDKYDVVLDKAIPLKDCKICWKFVRIRPSKFREWLR